MLDLSLPRLDGLTVWRCVRLKKLSLPMLVATGRSLIEDRVQALDAGADDCLIKPYSFSELSAQVRASLQRRPALAGLLLKVADPELRGVERTVQRGGNALYLGRKSLPCWSSTWCYLVLMRGPSPN
jgi:DNA-binding response OmpR family regulator